ncbi:MAG: dihydrofolate reductase [Acidobacteria bacterium]|nr:dihydrofolate reductase [Acidobacteriota bacterium]MBI3656826.1 dihydrofolate reductase [Acidobacteriota bacterium]
MISIIAAMTKNRVIGKGNRLPWHISEDLRTFKRLTTGHTILMGRKTFESIGKPLLHRNNIVISCSLSPLDGVVVCRDLSEALQCGRAYGRDIFIIGGGDIFAQALPFTDRMYISYVKANYEGDTYFPAFSEDDWTIERKEDHADFQLVVYNRKKSA